MSGLITQNGFLILIIFIKEAGGELTLTLILLKDYELIAKTVNTYIYKLK